MKRLIRSLLLCGIVCAGMPATAAELLLPELSRCDARFFRSLAARQPEFSSIAALRLHDEAAAFSVPDRKHPTRSRVMFAQPVVVQGLRFVGFFDEVSDMPNGMTNYAWGYLVADTVPNTVSALGVTIWDALRLRASGPAFVRSEVWAHDAAQLGWTKVKTEAGLPRRGTVERVLLVEPYSGETAFIRFGCSIQGNITEPILRELRPDLR